MRRGHRPGRRQPATATAPSTATDPLGDTLTRLLNLDRAALGKPAYLIDARLAEIARNAAFACPTDPSMHLRGRAQDLASRRYLTHTVPGSVERDGLARKGLTVGAGVHTSEAFVGVVGGDEKVEFTALGDTVNIAARLGGLAGPGELLVSRIAWDRAGLGTPPAEREVEIAGRTGNLAVVTTGVAVGHGTAA